jgi:hypothetical protein
MYPKQWDEWINEIKLYGFNESNIFLALINTGGDKEAAIKLLLEADKNSGGAHDSIGGGKRRRKKRKSKKRKSKKRKSKRRTRRR